MTFTLPVLALGLATGLGVGALAVGLVLVHRSTGVINLAAAQIGAFGAAVAAALVREAHVPYAVAAVVAVAAGAGVGGAVDAALLRRLRPLPAAVSLIATLGVTQLLVAGSGLVIEQIGGRGGGYPTPLDVVVHVDGVAIGGAELLLIAVVPVLAVGLGWWMRRTATGTAVRAASDNRDAAALAGIPVARLSTLVWAVAGAASALVALALLAGRPLVASDSIGPETLFLALGAAVLAGLSSLPGALVAGLLLGVVEQVVFYNWPSGGAADLVVFVVVVVALLVRHRRPSVAPGADRWEERQAAVGRPPSSRSPARRVAGVLAAGAAWSAVAAASRLVSNAHTLEMTRIVAYALLAVSTTVIVGTAGHVSLGQVGFFGLGAAASAQLATSAGAPFWAAVAGAVAVGGLASVVIGLPALRLSGVLFAVTTLGFALVAQRWLLVQPWLIGSGALAPRPVIGPIDFAAQRSYFAFALAVLVAATWLVRNVLGSGPGRRLVAVRDDEQAAAAFAVPVVRTKLFGFAVAGSLAALAGALYAHGQQSFSVSDFPVASPGLQAGAVDGLRIVAIAVIGGLGSITGSIAAATLVVGIDLLTRSVVIQLLVSSVGLLVLLVLLPGGLASLPSLRRWRPRRASAGPAVGPARP